MKMIWLSNLKIQFNGGIKHEKTQRKKIDCRNNSQCKCSGLYANCTAFAQTPQGEIPDEPNRAADETADVKTASYGSAESIEEAKENLTTAKNDAAVSKTKLNAAEEEKNNRKDALDTADKNAQKAQEAEKQAVTNAKDAFEGAAAEAEKDVTQAETDLDNANKEQAAAEDEIANQEENLSKANQGAADASKILMTRNRRRKNAGVTEDTVLAAKKEADAAKKIYNEAQDKADSS